MSTADPNLRLPARSCVVIPARLASTRLPQKLLLSETGKPLIQHTFEAVQQATRPETVWVATDHREIESVVRAFGGNVEMTDPTASSGTDRVAEVAARLNQFDIIVNVQGDEPEISGAAIDLAIELLEQNQQATMSTLATPIRSRTQLEDPSCVKVVFDQTFRAMYFSRAPIPWPRQWNDDLLQQTPACFHQHIGLYAYRREFLLQLASLPVAPMENLECLEQLRVLNAGNQILVGVIDQAAIGIDTQADYQAFVKRVQQASAQARRGGS